MNNPLKKKSVENKPTLNTGSICFQYIITLISFKSINESTSVLNQTENVQDIIRKKEKDSIFPWLAIKLKV